MPTDANIFKVKISSLCFLRKTQIWITNIRTWASSYDWNNISLVYLVMLWDVLVLLDCRFLCWSHVLLKKYQFMTKMKEKSSISVNNKHQWQKRQSPPQYLSTFIIWSTKLLNHKRGIPHLIDQHKRGIPHLIDQHKRGIPHRTDQHMKFIPIWQDCFWVIQN